MNKYDPIPPERRKCSVCGKHMPVPAWKYCVGCRPKDKPKK